MADAAKSLPVFETVGQSFGYSFKNIGLMIKLSWLWVILLLVLAAAFLALFGDAAQVEGQAVPDGGAMAAFTVLMVVYFIAIYSIAVGWHRALLLGEQPGWINFRVGRRELGYLGYTLLVALLAAFPMLIGFLVVGALTSFSGDSRETLGLGLIAVGAAGVVVMLLLMGRLQLVLPGTAVGDRRVAIRQSFDLTRGNSWRILGGFLLIALVQVIPNVLSALANPEIIDLGPIVRLVLDVLAIGIGIFLGFAAVSYMSFCYWFFVPPPQEGDLE